MPHQQSTSFCTSILKLLLGSVVVACLQPTFGFCETRKTCLICTSLPQSGNNHRPPSLLAAEEDVGESVEMATTAVLKVSYDGSHFHGWSAANHNSATSEPNSQQMSDTTGSQSRRRRTRALKRGVPIGRVRTVEGTLRTALAKLYGDVDTNQVKVEGCSRTDRGVHARCLMATVSCEDESEAKKLPLDGDLKKLVHVLNRMLPFDVRVMNGSLLPSPTFHPSLDVTAKTYRYSFAVPSSKSKSSGSGVLFDPLQARHQWQIEHGTHGQTFNAEAANDVLQALVGTHNFVHLCGSYRGSERKEKGSKHSNTICTLQEATLECEGGWASNPAPMINDGSFELPRNRCFGGDGAAVGYAITVTGDRFLYKMCRYIAGIVISAGYGGITKQNVEMALLPSNKDQSSAITNKFQCAPPNGLMLWNVNYGTTQFNWVMEEEDTS